MSGFYLAHQTVSFSEVEMDGQEKYWFPAKRYGWGWGPPSRWEGWVVVFGYVASVALVVLFLPAAKDPVVLALCILVLTAVLMAVCWFKGEPPHWRWGDR